MVSKESLASASMFCFQDNAEMAKIKGELNVNLTRDSFGQTAIN